MRVLHDSRDEAYRSPFGAVKAGEAVSLAIDVYDSPGAVAVLRTWEEGVGETRYEMAPSASSADSDADSTSGAPVRFEAELKPQSPGIVWYQFHVTDVEGYVWRYGACNGRVGGAGQLVGWEPPSFQLSVYDPAADPPAWHEPINGFLHDVHARRDTGEVIATLIENYPVDTCLTAAPWDVSGDRVASPCSVKDMREAQDLASHDACSWFAVNDDVFGFWRKGDGTSVTCALFNASPAVTYEVPVPLVGEEVSELIAGYGVKVVDGSEVQEVPAGVFAADRYALVHLWQFGAVILHFHDRVRLAKPMEAGLGILAHITSLPADDGRIGTLGAPARAFVDWLAQAGVRYWQVLPVNPTDEFGSPYAGLSAFAGNSRLLEGEEDGGDDAADQAPSEYQEFCVQEAEWLEPYVCFMAIRQKLGDGLSWQQWPEKYRRFVPDVVADDEELRAFAEEFRRSQFAFDRQWRELRAYANERGVQIVGDIPIYVSADSADVWAHPELFQLDEDGNPHVVAGCPPDAFAVDGQVWGNPVYDWDVAAADGYSWWMRRLKRVFQLYDYVRLDHFIGFSRYFTIPAHEKASAGVFCLGPGYGFFSQAYEQFGALPIIAEDLGLITPRVRALVADCGFPGMDIVQFVDGNDPLSGYAPRPEKIVYTGTHDNQTLVGYVRDRYPHHDEAEAAASIIEAVVTCPASVCILPLQDVIGLDDEARMNVPGVAEGNWIWQAAALDVAEALDGVVNLAGLRARQ